MKTLTFAFLLLASLLQARADDNWLENGDFSTGIDHWHGDGRAPSDYAPSTPFDKADPFTSQGLIIPLRDLEWRKVAQDFKGKLAGGVLNITYKVSNDLTLSDKTDDYQNVPDHIGYDGWSPFNTRPGEWIIFISDFGSNHGTWYEVQPKLGSSDTQTFKAKVAGLTPYEDKTITFAFPPGKGMIVILNVSLTNQ